MVQDQGAIIDGTGRGDLFNSETAGADWPCMSIGETVNEVVKNTKIERYIWLDGHMGDNCTFGTDKNRWTRKNELTYYKKEVSNCYTNDTSSVKGQRNPST